jgi:hypothetical protein
LKLSPDKQAALSELNSLSRLRDVAKRRLKEQQWNAFSLWWMAVTSAAKNHDIKDGVTRIARNIPALERCIKKSEDGIKTILPGITSSDALPPTQPTDPLGFRCLCCFWRAGIMQSDRLAFNSGC